MKIISIHKAKAGLSSVVEEVERTGERIILSRYGKPVVEMRPLAIASRKRTSVDPILAKVKITGDLLAPSETEWENA